MEPHRICRGVVAVVVAIIVGVVVAAVARDVRGMLVLSYCYFHMFGKIPTFKAIINKQ